MTAPDISSSIEFVAVTTEGAQTEADVLLFLANDAAVIDALVAVGGSVNGVKTGAVGSNQKCSLASVCPAGSECQEDAGSCVCSSLAGELAWECDINDQCQETACEHGQCTDAYVGINCHCLPGFTGHTCSVDVDECHSRPCQHGGTCSDGEDSFSCSCAITFSGKHCTVQEDVCSTNPCHNGGNCTATNFTAGIIGATCTCKAGFTGSFCSVASTGWWSKNQSPLKSKVIAINAVAATVTSAAILLLLKMCSRTADGQTSAARQPDIADDAILMVSFLDAIINSIKTVAAVSPAVILSAILALVDIQAFSYYSVFDGILQIHPDMGAFFDIRRGYITLFWTQLVLCIILGPVTLRRTWKFELPVIMALFLACSGLWLLTCTNFNDGVENDSMFSARADCRSGHWIWISWVTSLVVAYTGRCFYLAEMRQGIAVRVAAIFTGLVVLDELMTLYFRHAFAAAMESQNKFLILCSATLGPFLAGQLGKELIRGLWPKDCAHHKGLPVAVQRPFMISLMVIVCMWERNIIYHIAAADRLSGSMDEILPLPEANIVLASVKDTKLAQKLGQLQPFVA